MVGCWCGYASGARCRFAYGPADATATHYLLLQEIQIGFTFLVLPFWFRLTRVVPDKIQDGHKMVVCVCVYTCVFVALCVLNCCTQLISHLVRQITIGKYLLFTGIGLYYMQYTFVFVSTQKTQNHVIDSAACLTCLLLPTFKILILKLSCMGAECKCPVCLLSIPTDVTSASSLPVFKNRLKTYIFFCCCDIL